MKNVLTNGQQAMRKINERFRHLVSLSGKRRKTDSNKEKKEAEKRTDEKETTKLDQGNFKNAFQDRKREVSAFSIVLRREGSGLPARAL